MLESVGIQCIADPPDPAIHHVRRPDDIAARLGQSQALLDQHLDGLTEKTDQQVNDTVERIYEVAFELVSATVGDIE